VLCKWILFESAITARRGRRALHMPVGPDALGRPRACLIKVTCTGRNFKNKGVVAIVAQQPLVF